MTWFSGEMLGVAGFALMMLLIFMRIPVAIAMGFVGIAGLVHLSGFRRAGLIISNNTLDSVMPYGLSVIPLFIMMGVFVTHANLSKKLYDGVYAFLGHFKGGMAMATTGTCALFGAICGSSLATSATMTRVALPEMRRHGYAESLATACIAAGGTLGILIPPSVILIIYGILTGTSIGDLFIAGILPGLLATVLYLCAVSYIVRKNPEAGPAGIKQSWKNRLLVLLKIWDVILLFAVVMGGIYSGFFSTTEAAAVGAFGGLIAAVCRNHFRLHFMFDAMKETATTTAMIFLIIVCTSIFNAFIERTGLPVFIVEQITLLNLAPVYILIFIIIVYLLLGCFMDGLSILFVTLPVVFPVVEALGFNPVWFGILVVCTIEIGLITPPVGMNLFVIQAVAKDVNIYDIWKGVIPFIAADIVRIILLLFIPSITLLLL